MPTIPASELVAGVRDTQDFLVYVVASDTVAGREYRVDMQKFCGNGECTCARFCKSKNVDVNGTMMTMRQALRAGAKPNEKLECRHIKRVRRYQSFVINNRIIEDREYEAEQNKAKARQSNLDKSISESNAVGELDGGQWPESDDVPF